MDEIHYAYDQRSEYWALEAAPIRRTIANYNVRFLPAEASVGALAAIRARHSPAGTSFVPDGRSAKKFPVKAGAGDLEYVQDDCFEVIALRCPVVCHNNMTLKSTGLLFSTRTIPTTNPQNIGNNGGKCYSLPRPRLQRCV